MRYFRGVFPLQRHMGAFPTSAYKRRGRRESDLRNATLRKLSHIFSARYERGRFVELCFGLPTLHLQLPQTHMAKMGYASGTWITSAAP